MHGRPITVFWFHLVTSRTCTSTKFIYYWISGPYVLTLQRSLLFLVQRPYRVHDLSLTSAQSCVLLQTATLRCLRNTSLAYTWQLGCGDCWVKTNLHTHSHQLALLRLLRLATDIMALIVSEQRLSIPLDTLYVISGTISPGQITQPTTSKHWRQQVGHWDRLQSHQNHSTSPCYNMNYMQPPLG